MIRIKDIQDNLGGLVGWMPEDYSGVDIDVSLSESESGLYFQQAHPLLTLSNISSIAPDFRNIVTNPAEGLSPFSKWLQQKTFASIQKVINRFCAEKLANGTYKVLCENKTLFDNTGRLTDTVVNKNNLVGFEISPIRSKGVTTKINKIGLQFTEAGTYTLYLMHSSSEEPVKVITLQKQNRGFEWLVPAEDIYLTYSGPNDAGGSWYLCYKQSELPDGSKAIKKDRDWSKGPCRSCSRREYLTWQAWSRYIEIHPFFVNEELLDGLAWDIEQNQYTYDNNYGLNLDITVSCDITDIIIEQKHLFQDTIMKQVAVDFLREFAYNPNVRTNRNSINASRMEILYELDGDSGSMKKSGLCYQLDLAYKALSISLEGFDRICLPCKGSGVKFKAI